MVERELQIVNRLGLHARAAAKLVHLASGFQSEVMLANGGDPVDAKSILGILQLGAAQGMTVVLSCEGKDEREALRAVTELIEGRFGEES